MGNKLVLIGGGGHCKSVLDSAIKMNIFESIVITDPSLPVGYKILNCEIVGSDDCLIDLYNNGFNYAFVTVGNVYPGKIRCNLVEKAESIGYSFPAIIDPSSLISENVIIGNGSYIGKCAIINTGASIGNHCIVNTGAIVEHECTVGDYSHISVGTILCGQVSVGVNSMLGAGSTIIQSIHIGNSVLVGANSTVLTDIEDNMTVYGLVNRQRGF